MIDARSPAADRWATFCAHGGRVAAARAAFGGADWIDLSTGIAPWAWPATALQGLDCLPEPAEIAALEAAAARAFGVADAARVVSDVGDAIRGTGASFDGLPQLKAFFDQAALGVDELAEDIGRRSFSEMYDEVQAAARRRPALTAAAAMLAGFALYRLINAPGIRPVPRSRALVPVDVLPTPDI